MFIIFVILFFVFCYIIFSLILLSVMNFFIVISTHSACSYYHFIDLSYFNVSFVNFVCQFNCFFFFLSKKLFTCLKCDYEFLNITDLLFYSSFNLIILKYFKILLNLSFKDAKKIYSILIKLHKMKNCLNKQLCMLKCVCYND
jgi:hypothetical protein